MSEEDDVAQIFIDWLEKDVQYIYDNVLKPKKETIFTVKDEKRYNSCIICHICGKGGFVASWQTGHAAKPRPKRSYSNASLRLNDHVWQTVCHTLVYICIVYIIPYTKNM